MRSLLISLAALAALSAPVVAEETPSTAEAEALKPVVLQPQRTNWENKSDRIDIVPVATEPEVNNFAADGKDPEDAKR